MECILCQHRFSTNNGYFTGPPNLGLAAPHKIWRVINMADHVITEDDFDTTSHLVTMEDDCETLKVHDECETLKVGDEFHSYQELQRAINALEKVQNINFWIRYSRSIKAAKRRVNISISPALHYYENKYACIKGGRPYESKSTGAHPTQRTFKDGCNAFINVRARKDGQRLVVTKLNLQHTHPTNKVIMKLHS